MAAILSRPQCVKWVIVTHPSKLALMNPPGAEEEYSRKIKSTEDIVISSLILVI